MTTSAKCAPPASPESKPPELDGRIECPRSPGARLARRPRGAIHEHVDVPLARRIAAAITRAGHEERRDRVTGGAPNAVATRPASTASVPAKSLPKWTRSREALAPIEARTSQRDHRSRPVDHEHEPDPPRTSTMSGSTSNSTTPARREYRGGAAIPKLTRTRKPASAARRGSGPCRARTGWPRSAGRTATETAKNVSKSRGEVGPRVRRLGEQSEARAGQPCGELDRDEQAGGPDGDERGAPLRRHGEGYGVSQSRRRAPSGRAAFQLVLAALLERDPGADHEVAHRARHQHITRARPARRLERRCSPRFRRSPPARPESSHRRGGQPPHLYPPPPHLSRLKREPCIHT